MSGEEARGWRRKTVKEPNWRGSKSAGGRHEAWWWRWEAGRRGSREAWWGWYCRETGRGRGEGHVGKTRRWWGHSWRETRRQWRDGRMRWCERCTDLSVMNTEHQIGEQPTCTARRGALWHGDVIVSILFLFFPRCARGRTIWHENIVVRVLCVNAN